MIIIKVPNRKQIKYIADSILKFLIILPDDLFVYLHGKKKYLCKIKSCVYINK